MEGLSFNKELKMSEVASNLQKVLKECSYDQTRKIAIFEDVFRVLNSYPSLSPMCSLPNRNTYQVAVLDLIGTIPVLYQNCIYNIPIKIQYPPPYPNVPMVFSIVPTAEMMIKPSECTHLDGRADFKILQKWNSRCNTLQVLEEAKKNYSKNMPVFRKQAVISPQSYPTTSGTLNSAASFVSRATSSIKSLFGRSVEPTSSQIIEKPAPPAQSSQKNVNADIVKVYYEKTIKDLKEENKLLLEEGENLDRNRLEIQEKLAGFEKEAENWGIKLQLLKASVENVGKWIYSSSNENVIVESEEDLIEFKNKAAKEYLLLTSEEKAIEASIKAMVEGLHKNIIPVKKVIPMIRTLTTKVFLVSRLKDKALALAETST